MLCLVLLAAASAHGLAHQAKDDARLPVVGAAPVFALTVNVTLPLADPDGLPMIDSHDAFDVAVHEQPAPDASVIVTVPEPPAALID